jgi:D-alanyl-lipoteichoic acid acyltransferase DltB (MBOAT superfamily)
LLFNSLEFIFLPFTSFIYFYLNKKRLTEISKGLLVTSSLFFYSHRNTVYLPLILFSEVFNFSIGKHLTNEWAYKNFFSRKILLTIEIVLNVSISVDFKYSNFFIEKLNLAVGSDFKLLNPSLPLAISFYTCRPRRYSSADYRVTLRDNAPQKTRFEWAVPLLI